MAGAPPPHNAPPPMNDAPKPAQAAPVAGPGDLTKPIANVEELKARISHTEAGKAWHQPFFNPFADPVRCLLGYCCGCILYGQNASEIDQTDDWVVPAIIYWISGAFCLQWYIGQPTRSKIRQKYGLEEAPQSDCIAHTVLCCFAVCQESAELDFQRKQGNGGKPAAPAASPAHAAPVTTPPQQHVA
eukprot:CAMPEP_0206147756 /NCGR_PEP_ID=MMETSP1473-20131121/34455_1 /ASSEMBLY_ACC=CAM_ASM_001109 /TAXON_ID=1461547 /ORGANISM="Stichococcus sp, Strain RCC1054" /LENGTH=186 /DNA_ID=CAMNT_0053544831 /DNA_START=82 /DNA_END=642 /DNA_ORIENTATION=+